VASFIVLLAIVWPGASAEAAWSKSVAGNSGGRTATIAAPTGLTAQCGLLLDPTVDLSWTASTTPWVDGYEVRWGTSSGNYTVSQSVAANQTTYSTPALGLGTYFFAVRAKRGNWRSGNSNEVSKSVVSVLFLGLVCT
jgi:hypothetical protein